KLHPTILLSYQMFLKRDRDGIETDYDKFLAVLENAMLSAGVPITEIYTEELTVMLLNRAQLSLLKGKYEQLLDDTLSSRLVAPVGATDLGNVFLSLIHQLI
ncbi:MAG: hypothetical protein RR728_06775, partial [Oscillospiraceae bacterium]